MIDVSIVLNLHDERLYVHRTLRSLEEAVAYSARSGKTFELVVVLDRPTSALLAFVDGYDFSAFGDHVVLVADHGSLGPARMTGIGRARGRYVCLHDGDDLVSFDYFDAYLRVAAERGERFVAIPQFVIGFGSRCFVAEYFGSETLSALSFIAEHPYVSKVFLPRSVFSAIGFADVALTRGFAYEDYHFNANAFAEGYEIVVARSAVVFYRQRGDSLLVRADAISTRQTPHARLFEPAVFLERAAQSYARFRATGIGATDPTIHAADARRRFTAKRRNLEVVSAASAIDPAINIEQIASAESYSNAHVDERAGAVYFDLCTSIGVVDVSDVFILPFLTKGGAEKYLLDVMHEFATKNGDRTLLVVTTEPIAEHAWLDRLPERSVFVDLAAIGAELDEGTRMAVLLRLLLASGPGLRLHLAASRFPQSFFERFRECLRGVRTYYYRFCDSVIDYRGLAFETGHGFDFVSSNLDALAGIVSDHARIGDSDRWRLGVRDAKWHCLYAHVAAPERMRPRREPQGIRLLWASRLDRQKRPDLLLEIARLTAARGRDDVTFDVFGSAALDEFDVASLSGLANLRFRGPFDGFASVSPWEFDAFLYTSSHDGLPNVLLEAFSYGLPAIAPAHGGIPELVVDGLNGIVVDAHGTTEEVAERYVDAVIRIANARDALGSWSEAALRVVRDRHTSAAYSRAFDAIFSSSPRGES